MLKESELGLWTGHSMDSSALLRAAWDLRWKRLRWQGSRASTSKTDSSPTCWPLGCRQVQQACVGPSNTAAGAVSLSLGVQSFNIECSWQTKQKPHHLFGLAQGRLASFPQHTLVEESHFKDEDADLTFPCTVIKYHCHKYPEDTGDLDTHALKLYCLQYFSDYI